ncbi:MAG: chloride channel protein, partial [Bacillota bacterium]
MDIKLKNKITLIVFAILLGILVSLLAIIYAEFINLLENIMYKSFLDSYLIIFIPALGGLLVGILLKYNALSARGHGIPAILQTIKTKKIHFSFKNLWIEGFASALTIGTGGSAGRIGPLVEIGAGMADLIDKKFDFPQDTYQVLLGCGAAAAITAVFNAPLGGIVFSMEILFRDLELKKITLVIISALSANLFTKNIFNIKP